MTRPDDRECDAMSKPAWIQMVRRYFPTFGPSVSPAVTPVRNLKNLVLLLVRNPDSGDPWTWPAQAERSTPVPRSTAGTNRNGATRPTSARFPSASDSASTNRTG